MMSIIYAISVVFLNFLKLVDGKTCLRSDNIYESFTCGMYEYCCGTRCCRSPIITFYQMWYFWLMVFLTILFCSGGGWWYRLRNHDAYFTPSMSQRVTHARPVIHPAHGPTIYTSSVPMSMPPSHATQCPPPPPYYGPPPSYDTVVNLSQNQNQNQNQVPRPNWQIIKDWTNCSVNVFFSPSAFNTVFYLLLYVYPVCYVK